MDDAPIVVSVSDIYTFETIEVPGVDFLEVAASNDFGDYAGNTRVLTVRKPLASR